MGVPVRHKIVVVDDERPVLLTLEALLTRHGYTPQLAHSGTAGLALVRKTKPDLVLLDLGLPDADGLDVLREGAPLPLAEQRLVEDVAHRASKRGAAEQCRLRSFQHLDALQVEGEAMTLPVFSRGPSGKLEAMIWLAEK